jgi:hypothetical protein
MSYNVDEKVIMENLAAYIPWNVIPNVEELRQEYLKNYCWT